MPGPRIVAHHDSAGRVEAVRLGLRYADGAAPERSDDGSVASLVFAEGVLRAGTERLGPLEARLSVDAEGESASFDLRIRNAGRTPVRVESVVLGFRWLGPPAGALRFLKHGWQSWSYTGSQELDAAGEPAFPSGAWLRGFHHAVSAPPEDRRGWHESHLVSVAGPGGGGAACLAGAMEAGRGTALVYLLREPDAVRIEVEVRFEIPLAPGEALDVERVHVALGREAAPLLERFATEHGRRAGARTGARFQAGWCSWYHFFHEVTEEALLRNLEALAKARREIPIDLVQLDDGYQRAVGDWLETNEKFPRGLGPVAAAIRDAGFRAGLWTAPFCAVRESRLFESHPEWLLRRGADLHRGLMHPEWTKQTFVYALDPSREDVRDHLARTHREIGALGFAYQKLDFLYVVAMQADAHDPSRTRAERLRLGLEAIRAGAGEDAFLLGCGCPLGPAIGVVDGMRIGPDVAPWWHPEPAVAIPGIEASLPSTRSGIRSIYARAFAHRRWWQNDPDCLMARSRETKLTPVEVRSLAAAIAATGGMVLFSDDFGALAPEDRECVRETIALAREVDDAGREGTARALGLLAREIPEGAVASSAVGPLVALLNAEEAPRRVLALPAALGGYEGELPAPSLAGAIAHLGPEGVAAELAPHATAFARLRRSPPLAVFCDFDGTFAQQDVGSTLARSHLAEKRAELWGRYERREIDAWEYNELLLGGFRLPEEELERFLRTVKLDPGAKELVAWCEAHGVPFRILSDGFDRNLDRLQELNGVRFAYDANRLWYEHGAWRIAPGSPDKRCTCGTGVCKRARIDAFRAAHPGTLVVHVGDGRVSDLCAALAADRVFAKHTLAEELAERRVPFEPYRDLRDVVAALEKLR
ncbi:MAG TPA: HAD-IB family phosphatase [Myxococcota bacterium]|nr:HAD-IB family phosphatase [Myxococcota bacterium]